MFKKVEEGFDMLGRNMEQIQRKKIQSKFLEMKQNIPDEKYTRENNSRLDILGKKE